MHATEPISLSIVVGSINPWPEVQATLESILPQASEPDIEVIVATRGEEGLPANADSLYSGVVWLTAGRNATVHRLRAAGIARARGEVIAMTEDHCRVWPGWCRAVLEAHRERPEAGAVGGRVENGAGRRLSDWALFLVNHGPFMGPIESGERSRLDHANLSFKRSVLEDEPGEPDLERVLERSRGRMFLDNRMAVDHDQSPGLRGALSLTFHAGRSTSGLQLRRGMSPRSRARGIVASFAVAPIFFLRTIDVLHRRRGAVPRRILMSLPMHVLMLCSTAAGLFWGFVTGPGSSARLVP